MISVDPGYVLNRDTRDLKSVLQLSNILIYKTFIKLKPSMKLGSKHFIYKMDFMKYI